MKANVDISIKNYDENNIFVTVKREQNNLYMDFGICQFKEEMEIERFVVHNNI